MKSIRNGWKKISIIVLSFLMIIGMAACSWGKSAGDGSKEEIVSSADASDDTAGDKKDKAASDKKNESSGKDKKDDSKDSKNGKSDNKADSKTGKQSNDKKSDSKNNKSDDKTGQKNSGNSGDGYSYTNSGYNSNGGTYTENIVTTPQETPKQTASPEPAATQPANPQPASEPEKTSPEAENPKQEDPANPQGTNPADPESEDPKDPQPADPQSEDPKDPKPADPESEDPKDPKPADPDPADPQPSDPEPEEKKPDQKIDAFSGDPNEVIIFDANSYYEGDRYFLFFEKGTKVYGDVALKIEDIMDTLEDMYSMSFTNQYVDYDDDWRDFYFGGSFHGINADCSKINILIQDYVNDGRIEWAWYNEVMLFDEDLDPEYNEISAVYHELTHVLRMRQSASMGDIFEEGVALNSQYKVAKMRNEAEYNIWSYIRDENFLNAYDESEIFADPVQAYINCETGDRSIDQPEYQFGIRFVTFLIEKYGDDVIAKISSVAAKYEFDQDDVNTIMSIIKEATSEDVFNEFAQWLPDGWDKFSQDYLQYIDQFMDDEY